MSTEAIFLAGAIGEFTADIFFQVGPGPRGAPTKRPAPIGLLRAAIAGYVAAFVLRVERPDQAFSIGLGIDAVVICIRCASKRVAPLSAAGKPQTGERDAES